MLILDISPRPYTLVPHPELPLLWEAPQGTDRGIYLWCVEVEGLYLVNYLGKTWSQGGFAARLKQELTLWFSEEERIDLTLFKRGVRRFLPPESCTPDARAAEEAALLPLYRILLITLDSHELTRRVEGTLIRTLASNPATHQFLCNKDKHRECTTIPLGFSSCSAPVLGLNAPVPEWLSERLRGDGAHG